METGSCSNCSHIDRSREEHLTGRLEGDTAMDALIQRVGISLELC